MFTVSERKRFSFLVWLDRNQKDVEHLPAPVFALKSLADFVARNFPNQAEPEKPS
jgi:hypothetical protein